MKWLTVIFKVKMKLKVKIYPILGLWVGPGYKSITNKLRLSKFEPKMHRSTVKVPIDFGIDWSWSSVSFLTSNLLYSTKFLRLLNICVVLYIFSEAIATECSTSHMAPHVYWFLCMRTGSRHGRWNIGIQPASTRQLALDFTSCYWFSPYYICFACRNFICQHWSITEITVKKRLLASILFDPPACSSAIFSVVNTYVITGFSSVPHPNMLRACRSSLCSSQPVSCHGPWTVNASLEEIGTYLSYPIYSVALHLQTWSLSIGQKILFKATIRHRTSQTHTYL